VVFVLIVIVIAGLAVAVGLLMVKIVAASLDVFVQFFGLAGAEVMLLMAAWVALYRLGDPNSLLS
jgi:hypothetical protein